MVPPGAQRARRTAASAARDAISTAARQHAALLDDDDQPGSSGTPGRRRALTKKVSYAEIPIDADDVAGGDDDRIGGEHRSSGLEDDEADGEGDDDVLMEDGDGLQADEAGDALETVSISSEEAIQLAGRGRLRNRGGRGQKRGRARGKGRSATDSLQRTFSDEKGKRGGTATATGDEQDDEDDDEPENEVGTPVEDTDGAEITHHKVKGVLYEVINDEIDMEEDPKGETKVDAKGRLLGGREYKVWTLKSKDRNDPERLYALSIDVARTVGFADSSFMLRRLPLLVKVSMTQSEKEQAIEAGKVISSMKFRSVTMIPIRNVYKYLGAKIVKDGRYVVDDYYEEVAKEECAEKGIEPGSLVPDKPFLVEQVQSDQRQAERSVGAPFYTPGGQTTHWGGAGWNPWHGAGQGNKRGKLQSQGLNKDNWMWRMAIDARKREREIREARERRLQDFSGERLTVYSEQYGQDEPPKSTIAGHSTDSSETAKATETDGEVPRASLRAAKADDTAGLYAHDEAFRTQYRHATGSRVFDESQLADGPVDAGQVVVETEEETASRKRKRAIQVKPGEFKGFYEPHTNIPLVRQDLQPTTATMEKTALLPQVETKRSRFRWDPDYTFASTLTLRRIGPTVAAIYSLDYTFDTSPDEARDEIALRRRQVREAVEWDRQAR